MLVPLRKHEAPSPAGPTETTSKKPNEPRSTRTDTVIHVVLGLRMAHGSRLTLSRCMESCTCVVGYSPHPPRCAHAYDEARYIHYADDTVTCRVIKYGYWKKVERLATKLGLKMEHDPGAHPGKLWIAMHGREDNWQGGSRSIVRMAWRAIYAEVVRARKKDTKTEAQSGVRSAGQDDAVQNDGSRGKVKKMVQWATQVAGAKCVPRRHRKYKLISTGSQRVR
jgi:hypothetical protein